FDLFHAHSPYQNAVYAEWLSSRFSKPFVYEMRGLWEESDAACGATTEEEYHRRRRAETKAALRAGRVVAISKALKRELENRGVAPEKIDVVPNGVNTSRFLPRPRNAELAERLGVQGKAVFGYISLLRRFEGLDVLIEAAARILSRRSDAACLIVGDGPDMGRIRGLARQTSSPQSIVLTGRVPHTDVLNYYSLIDVFVVPRLRAPVTEMVTPIKPLEAMCMGKAVVVSDVGGLTELVRDGETGLTFPAGDAEALAETVEALLDNSALRSGLGERARRWVLAERDWSRVCQGYLEIYTRALDSYTSAEPIGVRTR
ncbi:MAG: glycosyltransferase family 4 protein, partial [Armatimonadota bacterium]